MSFFKESYRVLRSILFSAILLAVSLYVALYIALSLPFVQSRIKGIAEKELSSLFHSEVSIGNLSISPFSQIIIDDVRIPSPDGKECVRAAKIGAGISLSDLIFQRKIIITYAEILDFHAAISQKAEGEPLNIQFIIDAFKPKEPGKPPTKFDLKIRNVVIRRLSATFDREWKPRLLQPGRMDFNHLSISNLCLDLTLPRISNDEYRIDLRRLSMEEKSGFRLNRLSLKALLTQNVLEVSDLHINLPGTSLSPSDISLQFSSMNEIGDAIVNGRHSISLSNNKVTLSDFSPFLPALSSFTQPLQLSLKADGSKENVSIEQLLVSTANDKIHLNLTGNYIAGAERGKPEVRLPRLRLYVDTDEMTKIINNLSPLPSQTNRMLAALGELRLDASASYVADNIGFKGLLGAGIGQLNMDAVCNIADKKNIAIKGKVATESFNLSGLLPESGLGKVILTAEADMRILNGKPEGYAVADIPLIEYKGNKLTNIHFDAEKEGESISGVFSIDDPAASADAQIDLTLRESSKHIAANIDIDRLIPTGIIPAGKMPFSSFHGSLRTDMSLIGNDDLRGYLEADDLRMILNDERELSIPYISLHSDVNEDSGVRDINLSSDFITAAMTGHFSPGKLPLIFRTMLSKAFPSLIVPPATLPSMDGQNFDLTVNVKNDNTLTEFFNLPVRLLTDVPVKMGFDGDLGTADLNIDIPYLQQGKNKLIRDISLKGLLNDPLHSASLLLSAGLPNKNGEVALNLAATAIDDVISTDIGWKLNRPKAYDGKVSLQGTLSRNPDSGHLDVEAEIKPGVFHVNDATWMVEPAKVNYYDKLITVDNLRVSHGAQYVDINGKASASPLDTLAISLSGIDLDYIFETLNINYVTFGGTATGKVKACAAFSPLPRAFTDGLFVKNLSYNGAVLGNADLKSSWDHKNKKVAIRGDILNESLHKTVIDGGIWVTRDSLSFDLDADKVNIRFLQPFMAAFSSDVSGLASGKAKLYGTFSDIDLVGRLFADTISMKLDYTNTYYSGSDSVILNPGHIIIPDFKLYDRFGNSAVFSGWLKHRYFHDPVFEFKLRDAHHLLCYDTDIRFNPDWYGRIFGNGSAAIEGKPGLVSILVDMTTTHGSDFTFVLNDNEAADDYRFLSFTDRRKEEAEKNRPDTIPDFIKAFNKRVEAMEAPPSDFILDLRATITPQASINLIMDPVAGDRIRAHGEGAMQIGYSSFSDEMTMYGKYIVSEGMYNFTLQDLILKDFIIRPGSSVTFNGDPQQAILDITAAYRVNTNLTELDPSFASDRDLNRTNVPVEALLLVKGEIDSPEISFDIALPTVNSDVERKVKSIISTDDMMSRQVIYLLALNRFYTPDFTSSGSNSNGGSEFASVASSTISSQISNILGALSDRWTIAPSFRTDKGDFSDMEVDVTIASRLFNNRLLVNGNLGYRDRSTSNTTFVGDFDIEYLLNRSGNLRLKAYNHFNDQNYYLKSALTTQGVGVVLRRDFDDPFSWIKRLRKKYLHKKMDADKKE